MSEDLFLYSYLHAWFRYINIEFFIMQKNIKIYDTACSIVYSNFPFIYFAFNQTSYFEFK